MDYLDEDKIMKISDKNIVIDEIHLVVNRIQNTGEQGYKQPNRLLGRLY